MAATSSSLYGLELGSVQFGEEAADRPPFSLGEGADEGLHLPGVEPESVPQRAAVELDGGLLPNGGDGALFGAAGAHPPPALSRGGDSRRGAPPSRRAPPAPPEL